MTVPVHVAHDHRQPQVANHQWGPFGVSTPEPAYRTSGDVLSRLAHMERRPSRGEWANVVARKQPLHWRAAEAGARSAHNVAIAIGNHHLNPGRSFKALAHEHVQARHHHVKLTENLRFAGLLDSGSHWENFLNGGFFWRGYHWSLTSIATLLAYVKGLRLGFVKPPAANSGVSAVRQFLVPDYILARIPFGIRTILTPADQVVQENDMFGWAVHLVNPTEGSTPTEQIAGAAVPPEPPRSFITASSTLASDLRGSKGQWAIGAIVIQGAVPHLVPNWRVVAKTAAQMLMWSRDHSVFKVISLFTEDLSRILENGAMDLGWQTE